MQRIATGWRVDVLPGTSEIDQTPITVTIVCNSLHYTIVDKNRPFYSNDITAGVLFTCILYTFCLGWLAG